MKIRDIKEIEDYCQKLIDKKRLDHKTIVFFGGTQASLTGIDYLEKRGYKTSFILDNKPGKVDGLLQSQINDRNCTMLTVTDFFATKNIPLSRLAILIASGHYNEMGKQLMKYGLKKDVHYFKVVHFNYAAFNDTSLRTFMENIRNAYRGRHYYNNIIKRYGKDVFIFITEYKAIGDVVFGAALLKRYAQERGISNYVYIVPSPMYVKIVKMYNISHTFSITDDDFQSLSAYWLFNDLKNIMMLDINYPHTNNLKRLTHYFRGYTFKDHYVNCMLNLDNHAFAKPTPAKNTPFLNQLIADNKIIKGKTAILFPYSYSTLNIEDSYFWEELTRRLHEKGYKVLTNCGSEIELPIKGSDPIFFPIEEALNIVDYAGLFIANRNGMCDLVMYTECKKIIFYIYQKCHFGTVYNIFSFEELGLGNNITEIQIPDIYSKNEKLDRAEIIGKLNRIADQTMELI